MPRDDGDDAYAEMARYHEARADGGAAMSKKPEVLLSELRAFAARQDQLERRRRELCAELQTIDTQLDETKHLRGETLKQLDDAVSRQAVYDRTGS